MLLVIVTALDYAIKLKFLGNHPNQILKHSCQSDSDESENELKAPKRVAITYCLNQRKKTGIV